jgi:hypothetical protein
VSLPLVRGSTLPALAFCKNGALFFPRMSEPQKEDSKFPQITLVLVLTGHFSMEIVLRVQIVKTLLVNNRRLKTVIICGFLVCWDDYLLNISVSRRLSGSNFF